MKHIPYELHPPLTLRAEIGPWLERTGTASYELRLHLMLENRTDIPVESPLILFPRLGLDIRPLPPMAIKLTMSGPRKLLACTAQSGLRIPPKGRLEACIVPFSYDAANGAVSFIEGDDRKLGKGLADFRLSCAAGAANFPLRRVELIVSAAAIRTATSSIGAEAPLAMSA